MFDLNLGKNPILTIAKKFMRENVNDAGEQLNMVTTNIIMVEFKKYMFLCALMILTEPDKFTYQE